MLFPVWRELKHVGTITSIIISALAKHFSGRRESKLIVALCYVEIMIVP